ncbi:hypothetical protein [Pedobacter miscanthi]|uniref:Uncharacterized protein n=1 Tax=Pedobacter miscanthi TaxID=2259170 RepID=A0A366L353_9SPHI|nr:hypothetical protein [Pedobacter miscanthi]RBQ07909.1 hypothetical protein DRW42_09925 [Pedobacter miscanthi]
MKTFQIPAQQNLTQDENTSLSEIIIGISAKSSNGKSEVEIEIAMIEQNNCLYTCNEPVGNLIYQG